MKPSIFAVTAKCDHCDYECTITPRRLAIPTHKAVARICYQGVTTMRRSEVDCSGSGASRLELLRGAMKNRAEWNQEQAREHLRKAEECRVEAERFVSVLRILEGVR